MKKFDPASLGFAYPAAPLTTVPVHGEVAQLVGICHYRRADIRDVEACQFER